MKSIVMLSRVLSNFAGIECNNIDVLVHRFYDGEIGVTLTKNCVDEDVILAAELYPDTSENIVRLMFALDAIKRAGARSIDLFVPYLPYMRADRVHEKSAESLGAKVILDMIYNAGVKNIVTLDIHNPAVKGFFNGNLTQINQGKADCDISSLIVYPDQSAFKKYNEIYNAHDHVTVEKVRDISGIVYTSDIPKEIVEGRDCMLVDDIIATGGTLFEVAEKLKNAGAKKVSAYVTHAVLCGNALERLENSHIDELQTTDSIGIYGNSSKIVVKHIVRNYIKEICSCF